VSVGRHVFTDLGVVASRETTLLQLRRHPRMYEALAAVVEGDVRNAYQGIQEDEYVVSPELSAYACLFLSLARFAQGTEPGLPAVDMDRIGQVVLTGGASQGLDDAKALEIVRLFLSKRARGPLMLIDRRYELWVDGITWSQRRHPS
jgi:hypothetical protein